MPLLQYFSYIVAGQVDYIGQLMANIQMVFVQVNIKYRPVKINSLIKNILLEHLILTQMFN